MKKEYQDLDLDGRVQLAEELVIDYIREILRQYKWEKATREELKKITSYYKKDLEAVTNVEDRKVFIGPNNRGYNQLGNIVHEVLEVIACDKESFGSGLLVFGRRKFEHSRINKMEESIVEKFKKRN